MGRSLGDISVSALQHKQESLCLEKQSVLWKVCCRWSTSGSAGCGACCERLAVLSCASGWDGAHSVLVGSLRPLTRAAGSVALLDSQSHARDLKSEMSGESLANCEH